MIRLCTTLALVLCAAAPAVVPREAAASDWPVARLVSNLEARLRAEPDDAATHYTLGRVHAFAFALQCSSLLGNEHWIKDLDEQRRAQPPVPAAPPSAEELRTHLAEGLRHLRRACALEPRAYHHLTLAWLLETGAPSAARVDSVALLGLEPAALAADERQRLEGWVAALGDGDETRAAAAARALAEPPTLVRALPLLQAACAAGGANAQRAGTLLAAHWTECALGEYWRAFELGMAEALAEEKLSLRAGQGLEDLAVHEALTSYRRLVEARGVRGPEEEQRLAQAAAHWRELEQKPRSRWITPIVLSLRAGCPSLAELTPPGLAVPFDLDGDGVDELWPWLAPDAGWLVWDPEQRGEITSGRQLFGTASGWLFFADGYRVLDALDDDRDGALRADELAGLALWRDRDCDGVSARGEVVPLAELGVVALATDATLHLGRSPANLAGLELADGRVLPTFDWVLAPLAP